MVQTTRRRPFGSGGVEPSLTAQPPGLVPSEPPRAGCPITPRPRNERVYKAACAAAEGEKVVDYDAFEVEEGMRAFCCGSFLTVIAASHLRVSQIDDPGLRFLSESSRNHPFVLLQLEGDGATTGWLIGELDTPVYVLAPTPDAATASGAGASAGESTTEGDLCAKCGGTGVEIILGGTRTCRGCAGSGRTP